VQLEGQHARADRQELGRQRAVARPDVEDEIAGGDGSPAHERAGVRFREPVEAPPHPTRGHGEP
jgi:hypothetical protein